MRTSNSIKNSIISFISSALYIVIGFVSQKIFLLLLNAEYLGINGLFTNIISMLSIAELGIGEIIIFHLYKPIAENDTEKINILLNVYRKTYNIIALIVFIVGILFIPFLDVFIGETTLELNFSLIYFLFLLQTVCSYLLTYKRSILYANQKNYIINIIHIIYLFTLNLVQLLILYLTRNFYLYLAVKIVLIIFENIIITLFSNKLYPFIKLKCEKKLDHETEKDIFRRVKAQLFHKIGGVVVNSTDNIIISKFFGVLYVGLYSNYFLIINSVRNLFSQIIGSITASVGNLLVLESNKKSFEVYKKIRFLNFYISCFCSISILIIIQSFIKIWLGEDYLLDFFVVIVLVLNLYQQMMRSTNDLFLSAAGICIENRFVPIIESLLNVIFSIICLYVFGLAGVFIGTIISGLSLWCYSYPKFCYKKLFNRSYISYAKETIGYFLLFILLSICIYPVSIVIFTNNLILNFLFNCVIALVLPNVILILFFRKNDNFIYFMNLVKSILKKYNKFKKEGKVL